MHQIQNKMIRRSVVVGFLICFVSLPLLTAQYFGKNKPRYTNFDFKVVQTPHFEVYHYLDDREELKKIVQWSELWYDLHEHVLQDTFRHKNPLVFYNNHADFQQTSAISGSIGVSTGGVTEGLKNRVVMPIAMSNQQSFHVLGHEMVHAFQFHMLLTGDSTGLKSLGNLPLWIVEGMAEYMSLGRIDAHTAMWMRNAVLNDDVPTLKEMTVNPRYFPYRYGQAFWSFLTGLYGDEVIRPLFIATAKFGIEAAVPIVLGISLEDLSEMWQSAITNYYKPLMDDGKDDPEGRKFFSEENAGALNIAPSVSPNGRYVIFLSEKSLFTTDLYLADVRTGKIVRKVVSKSQHGNIDHLHYLESAGAWSPDSKQFAFVVFSKGRNRLVIMEAESGKHIDEISLKDVPSFSNPTWSPDGRTIVVNGLVQGQPDLFAIQIRNHQVTQLTNDDYAEIQPAFSYDGSKIAFATDRVSMDKGRIHGAWKYNLALMNVENSEVENLDVFEGANNMNPQWDDSGNLYFLSDRDGFRNIYRLNADSNTIDQLTNVLTGVSGITPYSPAVTVSRSGTTMLYTHYFGSAYNIYRARPESIKARRIGKDDIDYTAAVLPPGTTDQTDIVNPALHRLDEYDLVESDEIADQKYQAKFKLDYIGGGGGIGVGTSSTFGTRTGLVGGVDMLFSDVLGNNKIFSSLALNGEIYDFGGQVMYLNTKQRVGYGLSLSHIPYRFGQSTYLGLDTLFFQGGGGILVDNIEIDIFRIFQDQAMFFTQLPFSQATRVEAGIGYTRYSSRTDVFNNYYDGFGRLVQQEKSKGPKLFPGFNLYNVQAAYVGDNSSFGLTSPLQGYRYRIGVDKYIGEFSYHTFLVDARKYFWFDKFNVSVRGIHYARYGTDANNTFIGAIYSIDPTLVRGYNNFSLDELNNVYGLSLEQIQGSKLLVGNLEFRLPFTGPERLALIKSGLLFTDLSAFLDVGMTWRDNDQFGEGGDIEPKPVASTGLSLRVNLFGAFIIEPYYAKPLRSEAPWVFGINFVPGW